MRLKLPALACLVASTVMAMSPARADSVSVTVTGAGGRPLANAVVSLDVAGVPSPAVRGPYVMAQHNIAFDPHILIVPAGALVLFPNRDEVRHHVYSFSTAKKFELKLYGRDETKSVRFERPGIVSLGCNIHDSMSGFIFVSATPYAEMTDAAGHVIFYDVPTGPATVRVWDPSIRAPDNSLARPVTISPAGLKLTFAAP